jgi:hypothetical protein
VAVHDVELLEVGRESGRLRTIESERRRTEKVVAGDNSITGLFGVGVRVQVQSASWMIATALAIIARSALWRKRTSRNGGTTGRKVIW